MDPALLAAYDRPVPRYTSYPTAAQFSPAVGAAEHAAWLRDLNDGAAVLYLHVPFCRALCWYCACNTMAMSRPGTLDSYADALLRELEAIARLAPALVLGGIQWGGGTPGQLGSERLRSVGRRIAELFDWPSDAEISLEVDPRHCDSELAAAIAAISVNRVSLGVQDFDETVQAAINRRQSLEDTAGAIDRLKAVGVNRFNIDLVYGLPSQTLASLSKTLDLAIGLAPDRFAVFGYAHVPWMKPHQRLIDPVTLPGNAVRAGMTQLVSERLLAAGYRRIGLDHYARPGDRLERAWREGSLHRNFQGYVADGTHSVVGVGASAISSLPRGFTQNITDPAGYMAAARATGLATARGLALTRDDHLRGAIIDHVMCQGSVDIEALCRAHRVDREAFMASVDLRALERDGLVRVDDAGLAVTEAGRPFIRFVCAAFDRHYAGQEGRHSRGL
ncbi:MAG: oxygen-independent coproporphyrinogen III oxidase [Proteobacteria bacterium]|nr:oxygen-independent coproporphyrinogen III oxidase [Pseudomonadota bacterium]